MNAPLRRVGVVVIVLFGLLFANLNWIQGYQAKSYRTSDFNGRVQIAEYDRPRGQIVVGGTPVAKSEATTDELKYLRTYAAGPTYAHVVGIKPVNGAATGVEKINNDFLAGTDDRLFVDRLKEMWTGKTTAGGNVELTLSKAAQEAAVNELANNKVKASSGAVVALDPRTGKVLAMASMPSFDPAPLVSHNTAAAEQAFNALNTNPAKPLLNRATSETFPPGSTMKVITSAAALAKGLGPDTVITGGTQYVAPDTTTPINNAPGVVCANQITLKQALTVSCNTAFARLGVEQLGVDALRDAARGFGFESEPTFGGDKDNAMRVAASSTGDIKDPDGTDDRPALAQSCIGQANVRMTPLQGAMVAAAIANNGSQMRPIVVEKLVGPDLTTYPGPDESELRRSVSPQVAATLQDMMVSVVQNGTGRNARIDGFRVGGKTGTAQAGDSGDDHGWFIGFVMKGNEPIAAVAVLLEHAGSGGSGEATRIAGQVMRAIIAERGLK